MSQPFSVDVEIGPIIAQALRGSRRVPLIPVDGETYPANEVLDFKYTIIEVTPCFIKPRVLHQTSTKLQHERSAQIRSVETTDLGPLLIARLY